MPLRLGGMVALGLLGCIGYNCSDKGARLGIGSSFLECDTLDDVPAWKQKYV